MVADYTIKYLKSWIRGCETGKVSLAAAFALHHQPNFLEEILSQKKVKLAIIGVGGRGQSHLDLC